MMKILMTLFLIPYFTLSYGQLNQKSKDYYQNKNTDRYNHGFIPYYTDDEVAQLKAEEGPLDETAAKRGKIIYESHCMKCHGKDGSGGGPLAQKQWKKPLNLAEAVKTTPNFKFFLNISKATSEMPGWSEKTFSEKEISDLNHYLRTLVKK